MKRWNYMVMGLCMAVATSACAGDRETDTAGTQPGAAVGTTGAPGEAGRTGDAAMMNRGGVDQDFVRDVMTLNRTELELSKLAQQKAQNAQVKQFAAMMVKDHTQAGQEFRTAVQQANVNLSQMETDMERPVEGRERLAELSGAEFDREYIQTMINQHEKAIELVEEKANQNQAAGQTAQGQAQIQQWASKTLPVLQKHLQDAQQIEQRLQKR